MRAVSEVSPQPKVHASHSLVPATPWATLLHPGFCFHLPFAVFELVGTQGLGVAVQVFRSLRRGWHIRHVEGLQRVRVLFFFVVTLRVCHCPLEP